MSLPFKIALRFIRYNRSQSIFIILSIAIGISVQIFIGLLIQSLQTSLV
ncbi:MAG TPA: ABC transporter permease, partial [Mesoaciditoga lauensis]|nr:ABC transporter permease [Mesoaciditoga lauensis]